jgi:hypothetical protein
MGYYDVYDSDDNLIASDVWIDEDSGGGGRPIVVNWYKMILYAMLVIGVCTAFITPLMLFLNRDVFINNGWLHLVLPNVILGVPILIAAIMMLTTMKKGISGDPAMDAAQRLYNEKFGRVAANSAEILSDKEISDADYVSGLEAANKSEALITAIYLTIKFGKILRVLSMLSFLIYPMMILSYVLEMIHGRTDSFMIFTLDMNILAFVFGACSLYKNYLSYHRKNNYTAVKKLIRAAIIALFLGTAVNVIVYAVTGLGGFSILVVSLAFMDAIMMIDARFGNSEQGKSQIHIIAIIGVIIAVGLATLTVACAVSLMPGPIYEAILAFDEGRSTDLSLPITVWSVCGAVGVIVATVGSILVNKILNKKGK